LYQTVIIDLFDRKIIGWSISEDMTAQNTVIKALEMAVKNRERSKELIFHSDRGVQYACTAFRNVLSYYSINQSMSRKGNCWDNAVSESFFKTEKDELLYGYKLCGKEETKQKLFEYMEVYYNKQRRHSFLNYLTIDEFLEKYQKNVA
jgi:transposase InsO family protein